MSKITPMPAPEPAPAQTTCVIGRNADGFDFIRCLLCLAKSYHPKDIENGYCGQCHVFHTHREDTRAPRP
jgi:hypothetical protein